MRGKKTTGRMGESRRSTEELNAGDKGITLLGGTCALPPLPSVKNNVKVTTFRLVMRALLK